MVGKLILPFVTYETAEIVLPSAVWEQIEDEADYLRCTVDEIILEAVQNWLEGK